VHIWLLARYILTTADTSSIRLPSDSFKRARCKINNSTCRPCYNTHETFTDTCASTVNQWHNFSPSSAASTKVMQQLVAFYTNCRTTQVVTADWQTCWGGETGSTAGGSDVTCLTVVREDSSSNLTSDSSFYHDSHIGTAAHP